MRKLLGRIKVWEIPKTHPSDDAVWVNLRSQLIEGRQNWTNLAVDNFAKDLLRESWNVEWLM